MSKKEHTKPAGAAACPTEDGEVTTETTQGGRTDATKKSHKHYSAELHDLQVEFVKLQRHFIAHGDRILVLLEGRDSSGKDGSIKRIVAHPSPRDTRVVALGKPSDGRSAQLVLRALRRPAAQGRGTRVVQPQLVQPGRRRAGDGVLLQAPAR